LQKRFKSIPSIPSDEVMPIIEIMLTDMKLTDVLAMLRFPPALTDKIHEARQKIVAASQHIPEQHKPIMSSNPIMLPPMSTNITPNSNPVASTGAGLSERDKFLKSVKAVNRLTNKNAEDIVDMLLTLSKKDRSLCLFNPEYLAKKVAEAREVLEITHDDDDLISTAPSTPKPTTSTNSSPLSNISASLLDLNINKKMMISEPNGHLNGMTYDSKYIDTEAFVNSLMQKPVHERKQKLGDKLFPMVKSLGIKNAPKVTIKLLDTEELRELAHSMNDLEKFRQKVEAAATSLATR